MILPNMFIKSKKNHDFDKTVLEKKKGLCIQNKFVKMN